MVVKIAEEVRISKDCVVSCFKIKFKVVIIYWEEAYRL
jgi:hypothetical protein